MTSTHFSTSYMSKRPFPSLPTIASKPHVLNVLPGGVLSLISSDRERHLSDGGSPSNKQQMQQIAKEALRLTRETLTTSSTVSQSISPAEKLGTCFPGYPHPHVTRIRFCFQGKKRRHNERSTHRQRKCLKKTKLRSPHFSDILPCVFT